jgi:hypothetical protein
MVVRTVNEVVTDSILIETCAMSHCHDNSDEKFRRGLSVRVQESIRGITKFNVKIRPHKGITKFNVKIRPRTLQEFTHGSLQF